MTDEHVARPAASSSERGGNFERFFEDDANRYIWSNNSVRGILRNPVYAGHLAGYKRPIPSMKSKKRLSALPEDYLIVKNTHEPIIPPDDFELVQKLITNRRKSVAGVSGYDNIFAGIIKCGDCGYAMRTCPAHRIKRTNPIDNMLYFCNQYGIYGKKMCTSHKIEARELHQVVLEDIQRHAEMALQDDKKLLKRIVSKVDQNAQIELSALKKELRQAEKRLAELDRLFSKLYEDRLEEKISERNYLAMSSRYENEQSRLDERCSNIKMRLSENQMANDNAESWVDQIKEYAGIAELSMPLLNALIERVTISEAEIIDSERRQTVNIYYKFIGCISE